MRTDSGGRVVGWREAALQAARSAETRPRRRQIGRPGLTGWLGVWGLGLGFVFVVVCMARTWRHTTERAEVTAATLAKEAAQSAEMDAAGIVAGPADPKDVSDMLSTVKAAEAAAGVVRDKAAFDKRNGGGLP